MSDAETARAETARAETTRAETTRDAAGQARDHAQGSADARSDARPEPERLADMRPAGRRFRGTDRRAPLSEALARHGQYGPGQSAGRFYPMACVSLEVTQRCNLDCTLCYLSDAAELAHDTPLPVLFERIAMIESHYGPGTPVQISGGDPTLRSIEDLEAIVAKLAERGMWPCLMTNGIKASAEMLTRLRAAGLEDVAFHVDLTQERAGYPTEVSLNPVRDAYIARARAAGLRVLFNTTVFDGNLAEIPALAAYFKRRAADVALASFQLQAETGRGVLRAREDEVSQASVMAGVRRGVGAPLDFETAALGHSACNRYAAALVAGDEAACLIGDKALFEAVFPALEAAEARRDAYLDVGRTLRRLALRRPRLAARAALHGLRALWRVRRGLWASRGKTARISFLVHNFMDASKLERDRCESCVFMVMTEGGPLSMCVHNAKRDQHLFAPARLETAEGPRWWSAANGRIAKTQEDAAAAPPDAADAPLKRLKGRLRAVVASRKSAS